MEYRILGSLEVRVGQRTVALRGRKPRALLAVLLLHRNEVVSAARLVDDLWDGQPPPTARQMVKGYVSSLRRDLAAGGAGDCVVTEPAGYRLELEPAELDAEEFERLLAVGAEALAAHRHGEAADSLRQALALWRGPPLADFTYDTFAQDAIRRLEDLRLAAVEQRIAADLELGRHGQLVGELAVLAGRHPLRERLCELLMLALYRSDRGADALDAFTAARASLDELGLEPGPALRRLQQAILRHDSDIRPRGEEPAEAIDAAERAAGPEPTEPVPVAEERRKTVTALVCELVDSSGLGDQLDPELLRSVLRRYLDVASAVVGRHGGTVEKFGGDALLAVFGVPVVHEDDSMRAVRAAVELRAEVASLADELGLALDTRIGVNTGEVVASDAQLDHAVVTGESVNLAARLQQCAEANEILLGEPTMELVRGAVKTTPTRQLASKGKARALRGFCLTALTGEPPSYAGRLDAPLVGRENELTQLRDAFQRCAGGSSAALFTMLGAAGIGKSRLVLEARRELADDAQVLLAACPPYGEGITFGPLRHMLVQAVGEPLVDGIVRVLGPHPERDWITKSVARLLGLDAESAGSLEESFLGVRRLLERLAADRPLVLAFEDLHWAEPTLLDLIDHVADLARSVPIFLLCVARPELLEQRPTWGGGKPHATTVLLDPLAPDDAARLVDWRLREHPLEPASRARVLARAEGNPLFLEQLCAHESAGGQQQGELALPPTILALLATRVDSLGPAERAIVERAAIVGTEFEVAALAELAPAQLRTSLGARLDALVRKDLVRPARSRADGGEGYRFRHALIRDAAYRSVSKLERAELHERFADWLGTTRRQDDHCDELVGHHLEQAHRYRVELARRGPETDALARRASERLRSGADRARGRSDLAAAIALLKRAAALLPDGDSRRPRLLADLGGMLIDAGSLGEAEIVLADATRLAGTDENAKAHALVQQQLLRCLQPPGEAAGDALGVAEHAIPVFDRLEDDHGLCQAWRLQAWLKWTGARAESAGAAWERAAAHARRAGDERARAEILTWIATTLFFGPAPVAEGIGRCQTILRQVSGNLESEALAQCSLAGLQAMNGDFDAAGSLFARSNAIFGELGLTLTAASSQLEPMVQMLAGDYGAAERSLLASHTTLERMGERAFLPTTAALLARALLAQGRDAEAEDRARESAELALEGDLLTQVLWRSALARVVAGRERTDVAETLAREAVSIAAQTDFPDLQANALFDLAQVLEVGGRPRKAAQALSEAVRLFELKGNVVSSRAARAHLAGFAAV